MKHIKEFNFNQSRPVTNREVEEAREAIEQKLGVRRASRGRPAKRSADKYRPVQIRLHPKALHWARAEAHRRKIGYQTLINEVLFESSMH